MADIQQFEKLWNGFVDSFKGELITQSKQQILSYPFVKLIFSDKVLSLTSEYTSFGRWLNDIILRNPQKGKLIQEILTKDMLLTEVITEDNISLNVKYIATGSIGILGFVAAKGMGLGMINSAIMTLVPMAIVYPITSSYIKTNKDRAIYKLIDNYISQLNKYKEAISSILLSEE